MDAVACNGTESSLGDCQHRRASQLQSCSRREEAAVRCAQGETRKPQGHSNLEGNIFNGDKRLINCFYVIAVAYNIEQCTFDNNTIHIRVIDTAGNKCCCTICC